MRKVGYVLLAVFLVTVGVIAAVVVFTVRETREAVQPFGDLVARIGVQATPVILPDPVTIVHELNDVAKLETAEYVAEKIIRGERDQDFFFGAFGETILFVAYGEVVAGVDLGLMTPQDVVVVNPTTVMVNLPEAEILRSYIDEERSYVADRDTGVAIGLSGGIDKDLESDVRKRAATEIEQAALEAGILERANNNAELFMRSFLQGLGFEEIIFTDGPPPPAPEFEQPAPKGHMIITVTPEAP